jgi:hypothetical protein
MWNALTRECSPGCQGPQHVMQNYLLSSTSQSPTPACHAEVIIAAVYCIYAPVFWKKYVGSCESSSYCGGRVTTFWPDCSH